uniref:Uncharacterized protein n=1 Tax=Setaria viridis TaxID=4556 RepID=A0A4V6DB96_SETVI|nr:hypothetical protein SEVIR_4G066501v2 [Setaria viridis]
MHDGRRAARLASGTGIRYNCLDSSIASLHSHLLLQTIRGHVNQDCRKQSPSCIGIHFLFHNTTVGLN